MSVRLPILALLLATVRVASSLLSWDDAYAEADKMLPQMTQDEKYSLMKGQGWWDIPFIGMGPLKKWWYVGNTPPISRLGIPSLNMQDAAGGFRDAWSDNAGLATCWPSLLALAATWDVDTVREFAEALGDEFAGKGANVILGPSINVHRVARGGRNFEYLSGEDPYLGSRLTEAYVKGVQSRGVVAVMKHWIFNNQETHRSSESSNVDDKTAWELYYPPFQAAIDAGVSMAMCSYNKVGGEFSCSNEKQLRILKEEMGFRGFVQSDWYATHATSVQAGLDQEMPGGTSSYFAPEALRSLNQSLTDASVRRILAVMYRMDLFHSTKCSAPAEDWLMKDVRSDAHTQLARRTATESVVLLKNSGGVLPISNRSFKKIAVIGSPAVAKANDPWGPLHWFPTTGDYYSGGGSGHVVSSHLVTPLMGIQQRADEAGIEVVASPSDDVDAAVAAASKTDLTIIVAATTSGESRDRASLSLDNDADALIEAVSKTGARVVVIAQTPGAVLMPWRNAVDGIALMFLGGQETGSAWASVLFGDHAPTGRLPIMIPATESDTIAPSDADDVIYSEGLSTSYRNSNFTAAFPFGHGLTYTTFDFGKLTSERCESGGELCLRTSISNVGNVHASMIAQLYLELPSAAMYSTPILKGFQKTRLIAPGASVDVAFKLFDRDVSYYMLGKLVKATKVVAHVGASSADIRQSLPVVLSSTGHALDPIAVIV